ncbi:MAG: metal ABC transporter permease, partial [Chthoniobacterales bacterium]
VNAMLTILIVLIVLAMLASLQAVGVLLSLGLLILPAATMYLLSDSYQAMSWGGAALGVIGAQLGLLGSYWINIPSGPAIVMVLGAAFLAAYLFSPRYGIVTRSMRPRHLHEESLQRWD